MYPVAQGQKKRRKRWNPRGVGGRKVTRKGNGEGSGYGHDGGGGVAVHKAKGKGGISLKSELLWVGDGVSPKNISFGQ